MTQKLRSTVRLDKVKSVYTGNIYSIRANQELENGFVVKLGDLEKANIEVNGMTVPQEGEKVVLIANPAIIYDNTARLGADQERHYFMKNGEVVRGYEINEDDVFSVSVLGVEGDAVEGEYLVTGAGLKLVPSATPKTTGFCAKVVRFDTVGGAMAINLEQNPTKYAVLQVLVNK